MLVDVYRYHLGAHFACIQNRQHAERSETKYRNEIALDDFCLQGSGTSSSQGVENQTTFFEAYFAGQNTCVVLWHLEVLGKATIYSFSAAEDSQFRAEYNISFFK